MTALRDVTTVSLLTPATSPELTDFKRAKHYLRSARRYFHHQHPSSPVIVRILRPLLKCFLSMFFRIRILWNKIHADSWNHFKHLRILRKKSCGSPGIIQQLSGKNQHFSGKNSAALRKKSALLREKFSSSQGKNQHFSGKNSAALSLSCFAQQT